MLYLCRYFSSPSESKLIYSGFNHACKLKFASIKCLFWSDSSYKVVIDRSYRSVGTFTLPRSLKTYFMLVCVFFCPCAAGTQAVNIVRVCGRHHHCCVCVSSSQQTAALWGFLCLEEILLGNPSSWKDTCAVIGGEHQLEVWGIFCQTDEVVSCVT